MNRPIAPFPEQGYGVSGGTGEDSEEVGRSLINNKTLLNHSIPQRFGELHHFPYLSNPVENIGTPTRVDSLGVTLRGSREISPH